MLLDAIEIRCVIRGNSETTISFGSITTKKSTSFISPEINSSAKILNNSRNIDCQNNVTGAILTRSSPHNNNELSFKLMKEHLLAETFF